MGFFFPVLVFNPSSSQIQKWSWACYFCQEWQEGLQKARAQIHRRESSQGCCVVCMLPLTCCRWKHQPKCSTALPRTTSCSFFSLPTESRGRWKARVQSEGETVTPTDLCRDFTPCLYLARDSKELPWKWVWLHNLRVERPQHTKLGWREKLAVQVVQVLNWKWAVGKETLRSTLVIKIAHRSKQGRAGYKDRSGCANLIAKGFQSWAPHFLRAQCILRVFLSFILLPFPPPSF